MTHNDLIKALFDYDVKISFDISNDDAKSQIINLYKELDKENFEEVANTYKDDIDGLVEYAYKKVINFDSEITNEIENNKPQDESIINIDPYKKSGNQDGQIKTDSNNEGESKHDNGNESTKHDSDNEGKSKHDSNDENKPKPVTTKTNKTEEYANELPQSALNEIESYSEKNFSKLIARSNDSFIAYFCIDTPIRKFIKGKTLLVSERDAKAFIEKWDDKVVDGKLKRVIVDNNKYDDQKNIVEKGENMKAWENIKSILQGNRTFDVKVPSLGEQKDIGIEIKSKSGEFENEIMNYNNLPFEVLYKYGGRIPGSPGVKITGLSSRTKTTVSNGKINTTKKLIYEYNFYGKTQAKSEISEKYIVNTSKEVSEKVAEEIYGKPLDTYSAKSALSIKVNSVQRKKDDQGIETLVPVVKTIRVSGKLDIPFFKRKQEYSCLGEVKYKNRLENITEDDRNEFIKIAAAYSVVNEKVAAQFNIKNIIDEMLVVGGNPDNDGL